MTHLLPNVMANLRTRALDTGESEGITWLLRTAWRQPLGGGPLLAHTQVLMEVDGTGNGGQHLVDRLLRDAHSCGKRDSGLASHPGAVCHHCGGWAFLVLNTAGNSGPTAFTTLPDKPWRCPVCPSDMPIPALCAPSAHVHMALEARWAALAPERLRW
jgi:hypothetical protein